MFFTDLAMVLWLAQPIIYANMLPVVFGKHGHPIDGNLRLSDGQPLFGPGKTWEGLIFSALAGMLATMIFILVAYAVNWEAGIRVWFGGSRSITWHIGALAFGALLGDLFESMLKRRLRMARGKAWPVFDQVDALIGGWTMVALIDGEWFRQAWVARWPAVVTLVPVYLALHAALSRWAHQRGLKHNPH